MLDIRVELPRSASLTLARMFDGRAIAWAEAQALNRTAGNVVSLGVREVAREMGIPRGKLLKRGRQRNFQGSSKYGGIANVRRANRRHLAATVSARGKPFNISRFDGKAVQGGATHNAWRRSQFAERVWQIPSGAFVVRSGSSFRGVFGPGVTHVFQYPHIAKVLQTEAIRRFPRHFSTSVRYALSSRFHGRRG